MILLEACPGSTALFAASAEAELEALETLLVGLSPELLRAGTNEHAYEPLDSLLRR